MDNGTSRFRRWWRPILATATACVGIAGTVGFRNWSQGRADRLWEEASRSARVGRWDHVEASLRAFAWHRPDDAPALRLRAFAAQKRGRPAEALGHLAAIPDDSPMGAAKRLQRGQVFIEMLRLRDAEAELRACLRLNPDADEAQRQLLLILGVQRRWRDYRSLLWKVHATPSRSILALLLLAPYYPPSSPSVLHPTGEDDEVILRRWIAADPGDPCVRPTLAETYRLRGRFDEALAVLEPWLRDHPEDVAARAEWVTTRLNLGERDAVSHWLDPIAGPARAESRFWRLRGEWLEQQNRDREAADAYREAVRIEPGDLEARFLLARCLRGLSLNMEADAEFSAIRRVGELKTLARRISADPQRPDLWLAVGTLCAKLGRDREARAWFAQVLRVRPGTPEARE
jgi:tetratricopeptide (TPR) repeat protein